MSCDDQSGLLFPPAAIEALRQLKLDPQATMRYEGMSGGLRWSDDFSREVIQACFAADNWAFRFVLAYRASLIRGEPREEFRPVWEQLERECPNWPGLDPQRRSAELRARLESESDRFMRELDELDAEINAAKERQ